MTQKFPFFHEVDALLNQWVKTNTHPLNLKGLNDYSEQLEEIAKRLNLKVEWVVPTEGSSTPPALILTLPATLEKPGNRKKIMLIGHFDHLGVDPHETPLITWSPSRNEAIGAGSCEGKGGLLVGLLTLQSLSEIKEREWDIHLIALPNGTELGTPYHSLMKGLARGTGLVIGLSGMNRPNEIVTSRAGIRQYHVSFDASPSPEKADQKILNRMNHYLFQVGLLSEPHLKIQIDPLKIESLDDLRGFVEFELRCHHSDDLDRIHLKILEESQNLSVRVIKDIPPLSPHPRLRPLIEDICKSITKKTGRKIHQAHLNQPSLVNAFQNGTDALILDGLGPIGMDFGKSTETLLVETLLLKRNWCLETISFFQQYSEFD